MEDSQGNIAAALSGKSRKAKERKRLKKLSLPLSPDIYVARVIACLTRAYHTPSKFHLHLTRGPVYNYKGSRKTFNVSLQSRRNA